MSDDAGAEFEATSFHYRDLVEAIPKVRAMEEARLPEAGTRFLVHVTFDSNNVTNVSLRFYEIDRELRRAVRHLQRDPDLREELGLELGQGVTGDPQWGSSPVPTAFGGLSYTWARIGSFEAVLAAYGQVETWASAHPVATAVAFLTFMPAWSGAMRLGVAAFRRLHRPSAQHGAGPGHEGT